MRRVASAFVLLPILMTLAAVHCGRDVETCDTACALDSAAGALGNPACVSACSASQTSAIANGRGGDFQWLLTCIGNAGAISELCLPAACGLTNAFGTPPSCNASDAGTSPSGEPDTGTTVTRGAPEAGPDGAIMVGTVDATLDVGVPFDAELEAEVDPPVDAEVDADFDAPPGCSTPAVEIGDCATSDCCKFDVTWTCGEQSFWVDGVCDGSGSTVQPSGYQGTCSEDGQEVSKFEASTTSCLCDDQTKLAAYVESLCDVSPPP